MANNTENILRNEYWEGVGESINEAYKSFMDHYGEHGIDWQSQDFYPEGMLSPYDVGKGFLEAGNQLLEPRGTFPGLSHASRGIGTIARTIDEILPTTDFDPIIPNWETLANWTPGVGDLRTGEYSIADFLGAGGDVFALMKVLKKFKKGAIGTQKVQKSAEAKGLIKSLDYFDRDYIQIINQSPKIQRAIDRAKARGANATEQQYVGLTMARRKWHRKLNNFLESSWEVKGKGKDAYYATIIDGKEIKLDELLVDYTKPKNRSVLQKIFGVEVQDLNKIPAEFAIKLERLAKKRMYKRYANPDEYKKFLKTYGIKSHSDVGRVLNQRLNFAEEEYQSALAAFQKLVKSKNKASILKVKQELKIAQHNKSKAKYAVSWMGREGSLPHMRRKDFTYQDYDNFLEKILMGIGTDQPHKLTFQKVAGSHRRGDPFIRMSPLETGNLESWASTASHEHRHLIDDILFGSKGSGKYADDRYGELYAEFRKFLKPKIKNKLSKNLDEFERKDLIRDAKGDIINETPYLAQPNETMARVSQIKVDNPNLPSKIKSIDVIKDTNYLRKLRSIYTDEGIVNLYNNYWSFAPAAVGTGLGVSAYGSRQEGGEY